MRRALCCTALLVAAACVPRVSVPEGERQRAARELDGQRRFARVALFVGQFYGDSSRLLVSDQPLDELDLLETTDGKVISPPPADRVILPGTPLTIRAVEFPTGMLIAKRIVMTPRYHPWVYLTLEGEPRPLVFVLPQTLTSAEAVRVAVERVLATTDVGAEFQGLPAVQRTAIARKDLVEGMAPSAVEMAWGYPEKELIDRPARTEEWTWPGGRRKGFFRDGKLVRWLQPR